MRIFLLSRKNLAIQIKVVKLHLSKPQTSYNNILWSSCIDPFLVKSNHSGMTKNVLNQLPSMDDVLSSRHRTWETCSQ